MTTSPDLQREMTCTTCERSLPWTREHFTVRTRGGLESRCRSCKSKLAKARYLRRKLVVLSHYSGGEPKCACCSERTIEFLTIDHINGGGRKHRESIRGKAAYLFQWLLNEGLPEGYRVLCMNCNLAIGIFGACPHVVGAIQEKIFGEISTLTIRETGRRRDYD